MAIKISGTTVIDDSGNFTNIANTTATTLIGDGSQLTGISKAVDIVTPLNVSPADGATDVSFTPTLEASQFISMFERSHANTQFQVSIDSGFSNTEVDVFTGADTTVVVPISLSADTEHFFRVRFFDDIGCCSSFSTVTSFTTEALPTVLGASSFGGFYMGTICAAGSCYYLIMAPNASGCASECQWKTETTCSSVGNEECDGYGNTYDHLANATHPAGNWTATRSIGGYSDWYLPARNELNQLYINKGSSPAGEGFLAEYYWSSTECSASEACRQAFNCGLINATTKTDTITMNVRAVRRVAFP